MRCWFRKRSILLALVLTSSLTFSVWNILNLLIPSANSTFKATLATFLVSFFPLLFQVFSLPVFNPRVLQSWQILLLFFLRRLTEQAVLVSFFDFRYGPLDQNQLPTVRWLLFLRSSLTAEHIQHLLAVPVLLLHVDSLFLLQLKLHLVLLYYCSNSVLDPCNLLVEFSL
mmetsp:Transcript_4248/g.6262  ORF Transcript_4248/g.6262 Transcript_4248/m.6262 type:complete len:170 (-) Transcript_4248:468-977(-)